MQTDSPDDVNNRRIRQLIEQFNAEEAYDSATRAAMAELRELVSKAADLEELLAGLRRSRWKFPAPLPVDAVGLLV